MFKERDSIGSCCAPKREGAEPKLGGDAPVTEAPRSAQAPSNDGMIPLPGGTFLMGTDDAEGFPADGEGPVREGRSIRSESIRTR